uniref:Uncharacterized protein n=1 Tax=Anguilla anguilla TaxID=7936 RepID=A0A0E9X0Y2_ANGAN
MYSIINKEQVHRTKKIRNKKNIPAIMAQQGTHSTLPQTDYKHKNNIFVKSSNYSCIKTFSLPL